MSEVLTPVQHLAVPDYTYYGVVPFTADGEMEVYDGDTITLTIDLGMEQWVHPVYYRLYGIQAPEIRPLATRPQGTAARDHLRHLIDTYFIEQVETGFPGPGYVVIVRTHKKLRPKRDYRPRACRGKFGRWLVEIYGWDENRGMINLNQQLVEDGFAVEYQP